jgi:hypothetical protein
MTGAERAVIQSALDRVVMIHSNRMLCSTFLKILFMAL